MVTKVLLKKSAVPGKVPLPADLSLGELALNYADGRVFYKKPDNSVGEFVGQPGVGVNTTVLVSFLQPAFLGSTTVVVESTAAYTIGSYITIQTAGTFYVETVPDANTLGIVSINFNNATAGTTIPAGSVVVVSGTAGPQGPTGADGVDGISAVTTVTASYVQPAVGGLVNVNVLDTRGFVSGQEVYVAEGGYYQVGPINGTSSIGLYNRGYEGVDADPVNAPPGSTVFVAESFLMVAAGLRGLSSATKTTQPFTQPVLEGQVDIVVQDARGFMPGQSIFVEDSGTYVILSRLGSTLTILFVQNSILAGGGSIPSGSLVSSTGQPGAQGTPGSVGPAGPAGPASYTLTTASYVQPAVNANVTVTVENTAWMALSQTIFVGKSGPTAPGGYYEVVSITNATQVVLKNLGYSINSLPTNTLAAGILVTSAGIKGDTGATGTQGAQGRPSYSALISNFVVPAVNANVSIEVGINFWMVPGQIVFVGGGGGYYEIVTGNTGGSQISAVIKNLGYSVNATPGTTIAAPSGVSPAGIKGDTGATGAAGTAGTAGATGVNAFTRIGAFTQPAVNAAATAAVLNNTWMSVGQVIFIPSGGYYSVTTLNANGTGLTITNLGYTGNATPGTVINDNTVSAAGLQGPAGGAGAKFALTRASPTTTAETIVARWTIPPNTFNLTDFESLQIRCGYQSGSTGTVIWRVRVGILGTTGDAQILQTTTSAAQVANAYANFVGLVNIAPTSPTLTIRASGFAVHQAATVGMITGAAVSSPRSPAETIFVSVTMTVSVASANNNCFAVSLTRGA